MSYCKRLIEVDLPIKRISEHARQEKSIRQGHISSLHIWWARRPLAACRAVILASLLPDPEDALCTDIFKKEAAVLLKDFRDKRGGKCRNLKDASELQEALLDFIAEFSNWNNSFESDYIEASEKLIELAHEMFGAAHGKRPIVLDPFAGGGAMPLEAARMGAEAYGFDLNPLAVMLNKIILEYVPRYKSELYEKVSSWASQLKTELRNKLSEYYPPDPNGDIVVGYLWARTVSCEGPGCGVEVPIIKNLVICDRKNREVGICIEYINKKLNTRVIFKEDARKIKGGTSHRSSIVCPNCSFTTIRKKVEAQSNNRGFGFRLLAVVLKNKQGERYYRQPNKRDFEILEHCDSALISYQTKTIGGMTAIPFEELPYLRSIFNVRVYGINQWQKLFHRRQLLSALISVEVFRSLSEQILRDVSDKGFSMAIIECLSLMISNSLQYQCNIATYLTEGIKSAFIQGQSLPMKMDFIEANPIMSDLAGSFDYSFSQHLSGLSMLTRFRYKIGTAQEVSALNKILPDDSVDLLATDPPYYDVVPYADCSDFFYVWLKRMLNDLNSFSVNKELTPKSEEIVQLAERNERYKIRTKDWFEIKMKEALENARMEVKPSACGIIVFAHKETSAWEALIRSVLNAGWMITASWPIDTEKATRLRANDSAVLSSSIHLICRPRENPDGTLRANEIGDWRDVLQELPKRIKEWMPRLAEEGIVGADAIFACLGPALEIFSRYSYVEKANGEKVELKEYLEQVWGAVAKEALNMIFEGARTEGFEEDARLTAMWLWTLSTAQNGNGKSIEKAEDGSEGDEESVTGTKMSGFTLEFDAARKIAQGLGAHLEDLGSVIRIEGEKATLLPVSERIQYLFGKGSLAATPYKRKKKENQLTLFEQLGEVEEQGWSLNDEKSSVGKTVLDRLHQAMILFGAGRADALRRFLVEEGIGKDERFWRLGQALSALYPTNTDEKRWIDGVLAKKKSLGF